MHRDSKELSAKSADVVEWALQYARSGCPTQASHAISDLVRRIYELESEINTNRN